MIDTVQADLVNAFGEWETLENPTNDQFVNVILDWAWAHGYLADDIRKVYRLGAQDDINGVRDSFFTVVRRWLAGDSYAEIAGASGNDLNEVLTIHTGAIGYGLQSVVEQGVSLLEKLLESQGRALSPAVRAFPDHLRFGVPTAAACALSTFGVRHRRAAILLGNIPEVQASAGDGRTRLFEIVTQLLAGDEQGWRRQLGALMCDNTIADAR